MTGSPLYLPTVLPQWGIFAGVVLLTIGYVDKKVLWTRLGWILLILTGLATLYFNLFGDLKEFGENSGLEATGNLIISTGWKVTAGSVLAGVSLLLFEYKKRRYPILAILTLIYYVLIFFIYTQVSSTTGGINKAGVKTELKQ